MTNKHWVLVAVLGVVNLSVIAAYYIGWQDGREASVAFIVETVANDPHFCDDLALQRELKKKIGEDER